MGRVNEQKDRTRDPEAGMKLVGVYVGDKKNSSIATLAS